MTIDEAIKHAEEVAEKQEKAAKEWRENQVRKCDLIPFAEMDYTHENECKECAEEHRQLAEWLKDYKRLLEKESCEDSISRQSVIKEILRLWNSGGDKDYCMETLRDFVSELPPVRPIHKRGKWIKSDIGGAKVCNICLAHMGLSNFKYCPNCGAEMENVENEKGR